MTVTANLSYSLPANKRTNASLMLVHRLRRWTDINPYPPNLLYLNVQPLEVVSRYRDPQPQVVENYSYLFNLRPNIYKAVCYTAISFPVTVI